jgi:hypothetical protein
MGSDSPLAGSDAERRISAALAAQLRARGRTSEVETFWCRPNWPLVQAWHVALAVAGSLVAVNHPHVGAALILVALITLLADWSLTRSPGRHLSGERASQNIVSPSPTSRPVTLVVTAPYDAPRHGLARRLPQAPIGWMGVLALLMASTLVIALLRIEGHRDTVLSVLQVVPTFGLILAAALLLDLALGSPRDQRQSSEASSAALALVRALDAAPPARLAVELVLTGASADYGLGLRNYLRRRRRAQNPGNTVVLGIGGSSEGKPRFLESDGPLLPLGYYKQLRRLAADVATPARGRGCSAAIPARMRGLPAINLEGGSSSERVQAGLLLVDAIDAYVASLPRG